MLSALGPRHVAVNLAPTIGNRDQPFHQTTGFPVVRQGLFHKNREIKHFPQTNAVVR